MSERLINSAWRFVLMTVIFALTCAAMFHIYQGMLNLIVGSWEAATAPIIVGCVMAGAVYWIARHREDLVDFET